MIKEDFNFLQTNNSWGFEGPAQQPAAMNVNHTLPRSEVDHLDSEVALNNQVPPGMRANNYWDNFRSFSRQNRFSAPMTSAVPPSSVGSLNLQQQSSSASNVAQVQPRQHQSEIPEPLSGPRPEARQALIEPNFVAQNSPPRPRRKQKINREQNIETTSTFPNAAAATRLSGRLRLYSAIPIRRDGLAFRPSALNVAAA